MFENILNNISDGARIYLVPVGSVFGGLQGIKLGGTGIRFLSVRVLVRDQSTILVDKQVSVADGTQALLSSLPDMLQAQASEQLEAFERNITATELSGLERNLVYTKPIIMGVLNVTPDSFSDGGDFLDQGEALRRARQMIAEGADIIDVGGESTRPGAKPVWEGEEWERVEPVIAALRSEKIPISIDSRHSFVMDKALDAGAHIINDVSALTYDPESIKVAADRDAPIILMHAQGTPQTMQDQPDYDHILLDVYDHLSERIAACVDAGIDKGRLILDPGIGFGKRVVQDNLALINNIALFHTLGCPIMLGASRKRFIEAVTKTLDAKERMPGSITAATLAMQQGVQLFRVHDVKETVQAARMIQGFIDAGTMDIRD
ncbi:dihydropteroate synthase [Kordiimonas sp. SCSIO 12610]|uniref:dihydropteroate synthase n=1 Tax=Kordiimonas sp. SCSIO 12610 TaxID=2829597 RepID=UPI002109E9AD|nr:dihydropteroate synthase [Kordiimonas sp. SCSIO 12610]